MDVFAKKIASANKALVLKVGSSNSFLPIQLTH